MENGFQLDFADDETGILTEQSDLLLSDDGIVYDQEMMQLFRSMQGTGGSPGDFDHDGSFTQSQDSHPPDDYSLDLTDDLDEELASVSVDSVSRAPQDEDGPTPVPPPEEEEGLASRTTSLSEFQALEKAMRRPSAEHTPQPAEDEARLDEFLRDAEKSHVDYSQLLQAQRVGTPVSENNARRRPSHRDSTDFEVADISGRRLPPRPDEDELEMVNVHKRLDDADDPISVYDRLRTRMDEDARRSNTPKKAGLGRPGSSESAVSADTVKRPRPSPGHERRSTGSRASNVSGKEKQRSRPSSEVEQWVREQHNATVLSPKPRSAPRSRKPSDGSEASLGSGIAPLRPSHRLELASSKQDSLSSCDSDDLGSLTLSGRSESKTALKQKLRQEIGKVAQQADQIEQLKNKYGQLLTKHALAEVTIDQLRVNAKVNLDYQLSHSLTDLHNGPQRPSSLPNNRAQSVMEKTTQIQATVPEEETTEAPNFHSLPPSPIAARVTEDSALVLARPPPSNPDSLGFMAGQLGRRLDAFSGLVADETLPVADQEEMVSRLREEYETLHNAYSTARARTEGLDAERSFEGDLFQLGMRLDELAERVQTNVRWAKRRTPFSGSQPRMSRSEEVTTATSATTPSTHDPRSPANTGGGLSSGHSTGMSTIRRDGLEEGPNQELGDRLTDLEDQYLRLMTRYNEMKGRMTTPERDRELEALMKELTSISEEAAGLSQVISTPHELEEQFRFDREASILDQELEMAAAEEQQQQQRRPDASPDAGSPPSRHSMSRQGSQSSAGLGLRSEDLEWSSTATTAVQQRRGSRSGYTTGTTGGGVSDMSGTSSRPPTGRRNRERPNYNASVGSRSSVGDSGLSTPVGSPLRGRRLTGASRRGGTEQDSRETKVRAPGTRSSALREWSVGDAVSGPSDVSTASTVTRARRANARRSSSLGGGERRALPTRKQSQESRPISATSMESGQSTRLRSLEQDVHWLKEQLTGSQLSLGDVSVQSGLNLDRYDPESSLLTPSLTPDPSRPRRRRSRSQPSPDAAQPRRSSPAARRPGRKPRERARTFAEALNDEDVSTEELTSEEERQERRGYGRRFPGPSGPPILKPLRAGVDDVVGRRSTSRGRRGRRGKRGGMDEEEEEEEVYDPYQRYMSEPFALRRERHGMQSEDEETSTGDEDFAPRGRRSVGSYAPYVAPAPGRGILRPPGSSPIDDFPAPLRHRRRSRSGSPENRAWSTRSSMSACPLCGNLGLHTHPETAPDLRYPKNGPVKAFWLPVYSSCDDDEPAYPLREYISHGAVRYYVREYNKPAPHFPGHSRNLLRSFHDISGLEDEDREVKSINRSRLNESLQDAIRAAQSMSRVASKVRANLRADVSKSGQRRWSPLPAR